MTSLLSSAILTLTELTNQSFALSQLAKIVFQTTLKFILKSSTISYCLWVLPSAGFVLPYSAGSCDSSQLWVTCEALLTLAGLSQVMLEPLMPLICEL